MNSRVESTMIAAAKLFNVKPTSSSVSRPGKVRPMGLMNGKGQDYFDV
jgi:hypothetical protein